MFALDAIAPQTSGAEATVVEVAAVVVVVAAGSFDQILSVWREFVMLLFVVVAPGKGGCLSLRQLYLHAELTWCCPFYQVTVTRRVC